MSFAKPTQPLHPRLSEPNKKIPFSPLTSPNITRCDQDSSQALEGGAKVSFPFYRELNKPRPDQNPYIKSVCRLAALNKNRRVVLFLSFLKSDFPPGSFNRGNRIVPLLRLLFVGGVRVRHSRPA